MNNPIVSLADNSEVVGEAGTELTLPGFIEYGSLLEGAFAILFVGPIIPRAHNYIFC
jgi:hypothetical protein